MSEINPETITMEELAALANAQPETEEVSETVQPRNPDGTFATVTPTEEEVVEDGPIEVVPTKFSRTIDLGDGSGKQVFTADTLEALVDKLADAQTHATRKIRELNQVARATPQLPAVKTRTADEEYLLGQRLVSEPTKAMREMLEQEFGMPFDEIKRSTVQARQIALERMNEAKEYKWVEDNPDFIPNPHNAAKIYGFVNKFLGGDRSPENLTKAFEHLKETGLLTNDPVNAEAPPVAQTAPVVAPRRRASSLSSRISTVAAPAGPSEADLYKMPLDELYALANKR